MRIVSRQVVSSNAVRDRLIFYLDAVLICFQIGKPKRAADRDRLWRCYSVISVYVGCPYLRSVTGPEQPVLIGTDRTEDWGRQTDEGSNGN